MTPYPFLHAFDPARYSQHYLLSHLPEEAVQAQVLDGLALMGVLAWAVDVGGRKVRGRAYGALLRSGMQNPSALLRAKGRGGTDAPPGFADIVGILPSGRALFLEVKAPRWVAPSKAKVGRWVIDQREGEPSAEQLAFLQATGMQGALVGVVWSLGDAIEVVEQGLRCGAL